MVLPPKPKPPDLVAKLERLLAQRAYSQMPSALPLHCEASPLGLMVRGTLEWLLDEASLQRIFKDHAPEQYTRELTISALVNLVIQVSAGTRRSVYAAFKADQARETPTISTTYQAVYTKLGRTNPAASEALVRFSAEKLGSSLEGIPPAVEEPVPGYRLRVLDGNVLADTDHRLKILRPLLNACLPGKSLVVYEAAQGLVTDLVLCEDAYTAERTLLVDVLPRVQINDLWLADRNFCTPRFVFGVNARQGVVLVRQHRTSLPCHADSKLKKCGQTETGIVYEQRVHTINLETGECLSLRRIEVHLFEKTREGERTLALLTTLPDTVTAEEIAEIYRKRWTIESHFQFLTESLHCEVQGLGKPRAALFMFAMALVAGNVLAVLRGSIRAAHGRDAEAEVSGYYLADELAAQHRAIMKYLPGADQWSGWATLSPHEFARLLTAIARHVNMEELTKSHRGPKKPPEIKPVYNKKHKHYSTARLQQEAEAEDSC
jgi:hypothetical protein